jgi:hypothetical protein
LRVLNFVYREGEPEEGRLVGGYKEGIEEACGVDMRVWTGGIGATFGSGIVVGPVKLVGA